MPHNPPASLRRPGGCGWLHVGARFDRKQREGVAGPSESARHKRTERRLLAKQRLGRTKHEFRCLLPRPAIIFSGYPSVVSVSGHLRAGRSTIVWRTGGGAEIWEAYHPLQIATGFANVLS